MALRKIEVTNRLFLRVILTSKNEIDTYKIGFWYLYDLYFDLFQMTNQNLDESNQKLTFDEDITLHLENKWTFLKHLLWATRIDRFGIAIEEAQLKMLLVKILAENLDMELPITLEKLISHTTNTFSRVYHEYISVWMPRISDNSLFCRREPRNEYNEHAVAIVAIDHFKQEEVVGHIPLFISKKLNKFLGTWPDCKPVAKLQEQE